MGLPRWTADGLLPAGCWPATLAEVHERLVIDAQHSDTRQVVFYGLQAYLGQLREFMTRGHLWLDGSFVTRDGQPGVGRDPALTLAVFPANLAELELLTGERRSRLRRLFTMSDVVIGGDGRTSSYLGAIHPVGFHIAAYLGTDTDKEHWLRGWATGLDAEEAVLADRGFVEVPW
ncbi:hypothetical protein [Nocardia sp. XZ_19_369]|uniref:DUF6932 family protein n=1 Tax=Nocardia sp. XZ_19_369 TaxID=2769487 RepID=UPI0035A38593